MRLPRTHGGLFHQSGITLVELVVALLIGAVLIAGLGSIVGTAVSNREVTHERKQLVEQSQFAMQRITMAVRYSTVLLLPLSDNPSTDWPESERVQTVPASTPVGSSTLATAVLAVALPEYSDLDSNGIPDADDDRDGYIDEDQPANRYNDAAPGIVGIDDDGDGSIDEGNNNDDDEDGAVDEDHIDNSDNDSDGSRDEDVGTDNNNDGCPGLCGVDDNSDGLIDSGSLANNDEMGANGDDWTNPVVFYLSNGNLIERTPVPWDVNGGGVTGADYVETVIAENLTQLRFERINTIDQQPLIDVSLQLTAANGDSVNLNTRLRIGSAK